MLELLGKKHPDFAKKYKTNIAYQGNTSTASQRELLKDILKEDLHCALPLIIGYGAGLSFCANLYKTPSTSPSSTGR